MDIKQELTNDKDLETSSDNEELHCEVDFDLVLPDEDSEEANEDSDDTLNDLDYDIAHVGKDVDNDEPPLKVVAMDPGFRQKWIDQALQHPSPSKVHKAYF